MRCSSLGRFQAGSRVVSGSSVVTGLRCCPSGEKSPWPAHPNTLSFIVVVFADEITVNDRSGKETPIEALKRLTPEQQRGVPGKGKQDMLTQGTLTQSMIRTPLAAARKRVARNESHTGRQSIITPIEKPKPIVVPVISTDPLRNIERAPRTPWGEFPDVLIHQRIPTVQAHAQYRAAKDGDITAAQRLVDDFIGQGGTIANLKGYIESNGGQVILATTLTGHGTQPN